MSLTRMVSKFTTQESGRIAHEVCEALLSSLPIVRRSILPVVEIEESWKATDVMLLAEGLELCAVQGGEGDLLVVAQELSCSCVLWLGCFAMAAPRSIEHDQCVLLLLQEGLESLVSKMLHLKLYRTKKRSLN